MIEPEPSSLAQVDDPIRLRRLLTAVLGISSDLSLPAVLRHIVEAAVDVIGARYGALGVLSEDGGLSDFVTVGVPPEQEALIGSRPEGLGVLGLLIVDPKPVRIRDVTSHPDSRGFPPNHPTMRSFLGVPIRVRNEVFGNLYLTEKLSGPEFSAEDEALAVALAGAAAIAVENARLHARVRNLTLVEDRERIAADLHDTVIQRLFATGLGLQAVVRVIDDPAASARVETAVTDLDETIRQIRTTIFALQAPRVHGRSLRGEVLALATEASASLGFEPHLRLEGAIDNDVGRDAATHLLAVLREALANVVRHAAATRVDVRVEVRDGILHALVTDNGKGPGTGSRSGGRGLANLTHRAEALGGSMEVAAGQDGSGTVLSWSVPAMAHSSR